MFTAQFDADGDKSVTIAAIKDEAKLKKSLSEIIDFKIPAEIQNEIEVWYSKEKRISAAFAGNTLILGDAEGVLKCLDAKRSGQNFTMTPSFAKLSEDRSTAITFGKNIDASEKIVGVLGELKEGNKGSNLIVFNQNCFYRKRCRAKNYLRFRIYRNDLGTNRRMSIAFGVPPLGGELPPKGGTQNVNPNALFPSRFAF